MTTRQFKSSEIVVQLGGPNNQYFFFRPLAMRLRGTWSRHSPCMEGQTSELLGGFPDIPGVMVAVDVQGKVLRAVDPLGFKEHAETLAKAQELRGNHDRAWDTSLLRNLTPSDVKTALWELRGLVDDEVAKVVNGTLPGRDAILDMPGDLKIRWGTPCTLRDGTPESPYASEEELARMREGPPRQVEMEPVR